MTRPPAALRAGFAVAMLALGACTGASPVPGIGSSTSTPAPTPSAALAAAPTALTFTQAGAGAAETFAASETGYTGTFKESDTCSGIATVAVAGSPAGPSATFSVTPQSGGSCTITVSDTYAQKATVAISITTSGLVLQ
jgi:hypothetical protein